MTPAEAQAEIRAAAEELLAVEDRLRGVWEAVPRSLDEDAMFEGRKAWDLATEIRTVVECVREDLRRVVESLERVSRVTGSAGLDSQAHRLRYSSAMHRSQKSGFGGVSAQQGGDEDDRKT